MSNFFINLNLGSAFSQKVLTAREIIATGILRSSTSSATGAK